MAKRPVGSRRHPHRHRVAQRLEVGTTEGHRTATCRTTCPRRRLRQRLLRVADAGCRRKDRHRRRSNPAVHHAISGNHVTRSKRCGFRPSGAPPGSALTWRDNSTRRSRWASSITNAPPLITFGNSNRRSDPAANSSWKPCSSPAKNPTPAPRRIVTLACATSGYSPPSPN